MMASRRWASPTRPSPDHQTPASSGPRWLIVSRIVTRPSRFAEGRRVATPTIPHMGGALFHAAGPEARPPGDSGEQEPKGIPSATPHASLAIGCSSEDECPCQDVLPRQSAADPVPDKRHLKIVEAKLAVA